MLADDADLAAVSALLGHQSIQTTQQAYHELLKGEKERAVGLLPAPAIKTEIRSPKQFSGN